MTQVSTEIRKHPVLDAPLEPAPIPAADVVSGNPEGTVARWEVHETVKKAFHSHDSSGALLGG